MSTAPFESARLISANNPGPYTGAGNNTWLLDGAEPTLVDAGTGAASHIEAVSAALGGRPLTRVLVTHGHSDHASGVPALRLHWPAVEVFGFPAEGRDWFPLADGQFVAAGDRRLQVVHTPGHAVDHVCFLDGERREMFAGDMVIRPGSVLIPAGRGGSLRDYLTSLKRMAALDPLRLYPGHGPVIDNPIEVIEEYLDLRRLRETQILDCIGRGIVDVDEIVSELYVGLRNELRQAARMTVQAHLEKLWEEHRIPPEPGAG